MVFYTFKIKSRIVTRYYVIIWFLIFLIQQSFQTGNQAYKFGILLKPIINKAYFILVQTNCC